MTQNKGTMQDKIKASIELLRHGERLAVAMNPKGYMVAFSGGKDSVVTLDIVKKAEVKHFVVHSVTGIDSPITMRFMKDNYPEIQYIHQKRNVIQMIEEFGMPTMGKRYCCSKTKENVGAGYVVVVGVRAAESAKRAKGAAVEVDSRRVENIKKGRKRTLEQIYSAEHQCIKGKDKVLLKPLFEWTDAEIWRYISLNNLPINPEYNNSGRVGCMFCPFASKEQIESYEKRFPMYKKRILLAVERCMKKHEKRYFNTPEEYYEWWKSKVSVSKYKSALGGAGDLTGLL